MYLLIYTCSTIYFHQPELNQISHTLQFINFGFNQVSFIQRFSQRLTVIANPLMGGIIIKLANTGASKETNRGPILLNDFITKRILKRFLCLRKAIQWYSWVCMVNGVFHNIPHYNTKKIRKNQMGCAMKLRLKKSR